MEAKPQKAFLLIADISGYTKFMTRTKMSLAHAQVIITELMKSILSGPDVILVHRLLKNSIKADEYLLMTERSFLEMSKYYTFESDKGLERYEDLGEIKVYVHYPNLIKPDKEETADEYYKVSFYKKMKKTMKIGMNGMLIMLGLRRLPQFHNLPK